MKKLSILSISALLCGILAPATGLATYHKEKLVRSFTAVGSGGAGETLYMGGFYDAPAADANLTQASASTTLGSANQPYGAHVFIVAAAAGTASGGAGSVIIRVTGTSFTDAGVRTGSDTEDVVADITALSTNEYAETSKKFIGQVTVALVCTGGCTHTTYAADINYGFSKYSDIFNSDFSVVGGECGGKAGATDTGFDIELIKHTTTGWTYHATAFVPGPAAAFKLTTDYSTESDLASGKYFFWKRVLTPANYVAVDGSGSEGFLIRVTTGTGNAIEFLNCEVGFISNSFQP